MNQDPGLKTAYSLLGLQAGVNHGGQMLHSSFSRLSEVSLPLFICNAHFGVSPLTDQEALCNIQQDSPLY